MRKILLFLYLFNIYSIWAGENNDFMQLLIPADKDRSFSLSSEYEYVEVDNSNQTCNLNSACIQIGSTVEENNITYVICKENEKVIYTKTFDANFESEEGYTINSLVYELITNKPSMIFVEPGTCVFVQLRNEWRACVSTTTNIDLMQPVKYFYKIDNKYTNYMTLDEWKKFIYFN